MNQNPYNNKLIMVTTDYKITTEVCPEKLKY